MRYIKEKFNIDLKEALYPFIAGLIAHGYIMFSYSPNRDEFISIFHHGSGYDFGRWFHTALGNLLFRIDGCYSMPWLNGLIFLLFLSLAALLFAEPFGIKNRVLKYLFMILFVVFPVATATLSYMATAPFYALGVFLIALGFFASVKYKYGFIFGIFALCASMGIYQAYFALLAATVFFFFFIKLLSAEETFKESLFRALKHLAMLVAGLLSYFVINKIVLVVKHVELTDYQNLSSMGDYSLSGIIKALGQCYRDFFGIFTGDHYFIFPYKILNFIVLVLWILFAACVLYLIVTRTKKQPLNVVFVLGLMLLMPVAFFLINPMCAEFMNGIHTLMCYGAFFMFAAPILVFDKTDLKVQAERYLSCAVSAILIFVVFIYIRYSNMTYFAYDLHYDQAYFEFSSVADGIRNAEGYADELPVVFVGNYTDHSKLWELRYADALTGAYNTGYVMNGEERRANFFRFFLGFTYNEEYPTEEILADPEIKAMPSFPDNGSIKVVDGRVIVKFSD